MITLIKRHKILDMVAVSYQENARWKEQDDNLRRKYKKKIDEIPYELEKLSAEHLYEIITWIIKYHDDKQE